LSISCWSIFGMLKELDKIVFLKER
jgi:hypothetical protein